MALDIVKVESVRQAAAVLSAGDGARFLAGGTLLVRAVTSGDVSIRRLVLSDGLGLDRLEVGADIEIGSAVTMARIVAEPKLAFLKPVAESIGGPAVRAMATVGGNLFARYPYGDFAVALLALGATLVTESLDGEAIEDLEAFLSRPIENGRVVRSIRFKAPPAGAFRFAKVVRRHPHGASVLSIAAVLPVAERKVTGARLAYGAMAKRPMRAKAVERALEGKALDAATVDAALKVATEGCAPLSDSQASAWYRMTVLPVHLKRLLAGERSR
jgi:CO/xanthine dehydrogenase FAD-binding subunit